MRSFAALALLTAGCGGTSAAPDEVALERFEEGNALFAQGRYAEAAPHYEFAVSVRDRFKEAHYRLAYCREQTGDESGAVAALEKVLRSDRHDAKALRGLARLYTHRGYAGPAIDALKALPLPTAEELAEIERLESLAKKKE